MWPKQGKVVIRIGKKEGVIKAWWQLSTVGANQPNDSV